MARAQSLRTRIVAQLDVERGGDVRGHLAERVLRRANVDRLPVAVEHEHDGLVQYVIHKKWLLTGGVRHEFRRRGFLFPSLVTNHRSRA